MTFKSVEIFRPRWAPGDLEGYETDTVPATMPSVGRRTTCLPRETWQAEKLRGHGHEAVRGEPSPHAA